MKSAAFCIAAFAVCCANGLVVKSKCSVMARTSSLPPRKTLMQKCVPNQNDGDPDVVEDVTRLSTLPPQKATNTEPIDMKTYFFGKEGEFAGDMSRSGLDVKRFVTYNLLALVLALGANFLGITTFLMSSTSPDYFRGLGFDQLYSIGGYRKHVDVEDKYEYRFPEKWLIDQSILMADARDRDLPRALKEKRSVGMRPDSAYGPAGGDGRENVSVVKSRVMAGFSLQGTLGGPKEAAERLLQNVIAAPGSGKSYELIDAYEEMREGSPAYVFEYTVKREGAGAFYQHSVSVIMSRGSELFTFTAVAPQAKWDELKDTITTTAKTFKIASPAIPAGFY